MKDTPDDVERRYHAMLMALPPGRRLAMALGMFETARALAEAGLRAEGVTDPAEMRRRLFLRFYGDDFGPAECDRILAALDDLAHEPLHGAGPAGTSTDGKTSADHDETLYGSSR